MAEKSLVECVLLTMHENTHDYIGLKILDKQILQAGYFLGESDLT